MTTTNERADTQALACGERAPHRPSLSPSRQSARSKLMIGMILLFPASAFAYVDPNAGGMLFQLLMPLFAAIAGAWLFLRRWIAAWAVALWKKLTGTEPK